MSKNKEILATVFSGITVAGKFNFTSKDFETTYHQFLMNYFNNKKENVKTTEQSEDQLWEDAQKGIYALSILLGNHDLVATITYCNNGDCSLGYSLSEQALMPILESDDDLNVDLFITFLKESLAIIRPNKLQIQKPSLNKSWILREDVQDAFKKHGMIPCIFQDTLEVCYLYKYEENGENCYKGFYIKDAVKYVTANINLDLEPVINAYYKNPGQIDLILNTKKRSEYYIRQAKDCYNVSKCLEFYSYALWLDPLNEEINKIFKNVTNGIIDFKEAKAKVADNKELMDKLKKVHFKLRHDFNIHTVKLNKNFYNTDFTFYACNKLILEEPELFKDHFICFINNIESIANMLIIKKIDENNFIILDRHCEKINPAEELVNFIRINLNLLINHWEGNISEVHLTNTIRTGN